MPNNLVYKKKVVTLHSQSREIAIQNKTIKIRCVSSAG